MTVVVGPANAEMTDVEIILVKADQNDDSLLSKAEVLEVAIQQFAIADTDGNGMLEKDEAEDMAADPEFSDNDSDKDGSLSINEMIEEKLADFASIDKDGDGALSLDELNATYGNK
jgi:Ca2+-binding EF-hand superfamily protein